MTFDFYILRFPSISSEKILFGQWHEEYFSLLHSPFPSPFPSPFTFQLLLPSLLSLLPPFFFFIFQKTELFFLRVWRPSKHPISIVGANLEQKCQSFTLFTLLGDLENFMNPSIFFFLTVFLDRIFFSKSAILLQQKTTRKYSPQNKLVFKVKLNPQNGYWNVNRRLSLTREKKERKIA